MFYRKKKSFSDVIQNTLHTNILLNGVSFGVIVKHLFPKYTKCLNVEETTEELEKVLFHELYTSKDITGWSYNSKWIKKDDTFLYTHTHILHYTYNNM